jgi:uncharacterized protein YfaS (alpha-2-macroglobulin family)
VSDHFIPGESARISVAVTDAAGIAADPGALRLRVKPPSGVVATYTLGASVFIVKEAVGSYHADILLTSAGVWAWRWELDAPNAGAAEGVIPVLKSRVI